MLPHGWFAGPEHATFELAPEQREVRGGALVLHGFGGTPAEMRPLAHALVEQGLFVRAPLLPGFGAEMHQLATVSAGDWLAVASQAWIDLTARHPDSVLIGYSMGAALALRLATGDHRCVWCCSRRCGGCWVLPGHLAPSCPSCAT